jgi:type IV pilus assembly protein PilA
MLARLRTMKEENEGGFTLIELLVVIIIIGILAAIAIPVFLNQRKKGYDASVKADLHNIATAEETYLTDNPSGYTAALSTLSTNSQVQTSTGNLFAIGVSGAKGYCIVGKNGNSSNYWTWDSQGGGLTATSVTTLSAAETTPQCSTTYSYTVGTGLS